MAISRELVIFVKNTTESSVSQIKTNRLGVIITEYITEIMANKREFKKFVDELGATVIDEMVDAYRNVKDVNHDKIAEAMEMLLGAIGKAKNNSNVFFDRGERAFQDKKEYAKAKKEFFKALFNKIQTEFSEEVNQALKLFNSALPAEERERNKAYASANA